MTRQPPGFQCPPSLQLLCLYLQPGLPGDSRSVYPVTSSPFPFHLPTWTWNFCCQPCFPCTFFILLIGNRIIPSAQAKCFQVIPNSSLSLTNFKMLSVLTLLTIPPLLLNISKPLTLTLAIEYFMADFFLFSLSIWFVLVTSLLYKDTRQYVGKWIQSQSMQITSLNAYSSLVKCGDWVRSSLLDS